LLGEFSCGSFGERTGQGIADTSIGQTAETFTLLIAGTSRQGAWTESLLLSMLRQSDAALIARCGKGRDLDASHAVDALLAQPDRPRRDRDVIERAFELGDAA
jgi:hypothetical protein